MKENKVRVLLVEDSSFDEFFIQRALMRNCPEMSLSVARDGAEARSYLFAEGASFDLVLLDLKLPKVSGFDLIEGVRGDPRYARIPVMIMTGSEDPVHAAKCMKAGATAVIYKSLDQEKYCAEVGAAVNAALNRTIHLL